MTELGAPNHRGTKKGLFNKLSEELDETVVIGTSEEGARY